MGRKKLEIRYREKARTRISTYKTRIKGLEKKAKELSVLCGVDVLFTASSPDLNTFQFWPTNPTDLYRVVDRYKAVSLPSPHLNSAFQEELTSINNKLQEVRQRICFLEAEKITGSSISQHSCQSSYSVEAVIDTLSHLNSLPSTPSEDQRFMEHEDFCLPALTDTDGDDHIYSMLEDLGEDLILKCELNVHNYDDYHFDSLAMSSD